ncbi:hypothetical protein ACWD4G_26410 [Streptomyces sp. NPDC002643]
MKTPVSAVSAAAVGVAACALLSVPATTFVAAPDAAAESSTSSVIAGSALHDALADGTTVGTLDYCEPKANDGPCV